MNKKLVLAFAVGVIATSAQANLKDTVTDAGKKALSGVKNFVDFPNGLVFGDGSTLGQNVHAQAPLVARLALTSYLSHKALKKACENERVREFVKKVTGGRCCNKNK